MLSYYLFCWNNQVTILDTKITIDVESLMKAESDSNVLTEYVSYYTTQMLLDEANRQLNGRTLTEKEKAEMFIN